MELFGEIVLGGWSIESVNWQLYVTFKEDANTALDKQAAMNQNIIRKWCFSILKMIELYRIKVCHVVYRLTIDNRVKKNYYY